MPRKRAAPTRVARFRVTLEEIAPPVWRTFEIDAGGTFWDLHVAIQDAFGWLDCHLHVFEAGDPEDRVPVEIGIPDPDGFDARRVLPGWDVEVGRVLVNPGEGMIYRYDFGDDWQHVVLLEAVGQADPGTRIPRCVGGARACPPEDCGGPSGYEHLLEVLADPDHEEHAELVDWMPKGFDPEAFDPRSVRFSDPKRRLRALLRG